MPHVDELTLMMYADKELSADEQTQVTKHLAKCATCQEALARWQEENSLFTATFTPSPEALAPLPLSENTLAQIEAIASLHEHHHKLSYHRTLGWLSGAVAVVLFYFTLFHHWINDATEGGTAFWQHQTLWTSLFWLKQQASNLLLIPYQNMFLISLFFAVLLGLLLVLNTRSKAVQNWYQWGGGTEQ